jgi:hypothetical protein
MGIEADNIGCFGYIDSHRLIKEEKDNMRAGSRLTNYGRLDLHNQLLEI